MLALPLFLLFFMGPDGKASERQLADFSRFTTAIGAEIAIVDREGIVREGVVTAATADEVTMNFSGTERTFSRDVVASGERLKDGRRDGAIKGAIFGAVAGLLVWQGDSSRYSAAEVAANWAAVAAFYGGVGWLIDAAQPHREPIYRSLPVTQSTTSGVKLTLRF